MLAPVLSGETQPTAISRKPESGNRSPASDYVLTMSLATKLNLNEGETITVHHQPGDVDVDLPVGDGPAVLVFVTNRSELDQRKAPLVGAARKDELAWLAYPKAKQLDTDLNRDVIWELMGDDGVRPVRQVSIDDVWSALRFRPL